MGKNIRELISQMTLEEKAGMCSGLDSWHTKPVERLGIPSIMMADGPHGLRKQSGESDNMDFNKAVPSVCFPTGAALACSWDRELLGKVAAAIGEECQSEGVSIILGPAVNIKRSPLCGRNFEYYSEDPYLSSELAASYIQSIQAKGVGTSLKHYTANNMETRRMTTDTLVDERTLREIYLASFESAVRKGRPWTVMCSYNRLNGTYLSENKKMLTQVLKEQWGHEGFVVSDWGAVDNRDDGVLAGLELQMPYDGGHGDQNIIEAVKSGKLPESVLDAAVERILKVVFKAAELRKPGFSCNKVEHHAIARRAAAECMVLLKNEDAVLPLKKGGKVAVIGAFAVHPRYQGGGSSHINPSRLDEPLAEIKAVAGRDTTIVYAPGYRLESGEGGIFVSKTFESESDVPDETLIAEACETAAASDVAVIFAGLPESYESEGFDRRHMRIPEGQIKLIQAVSGIQKNTVVVLSNGSPIEMPWADQVKGILEGYLGGQAFGGAAADVLFGVVNPCGRLAETFPKKLSDNPSYLNFVSDKKKVEYREGIFVGYRYYDAKEMDPLFPFGYGLSYTNFMYSGLTADKEELKDTETLTVSVRVRNTGSVAGKEVVQLYVRDPECSVVRPVRELKGFAKVELAPGEEKTVSFTLDKRSFAFYNPDIADWYAESGDYEILIGRSSRDIVLKKTVRVVSTTKIPKHFDRNSTLEEILADPKGAELFGRLFQSMSEQAKAEGAPDFSMVMQNPALWTMVKESPLRSVFMFTMGKISEEMVSGLLDEMNRCAE